MKKTVLLAAFLFFTIFSNSIYSEDTLTGTIKDENSNPVNDATIFLKLKDITVKTDNSGSFELITNSTPINHISNNSTNFINFSKSNLFINLSISQNVKLDIFSLSGKKNSLINSYMNSGTHRVELKKLQQLSNGIYFIKGSIGNKDYSNKVIIQDQIIYNYQLKKQERNLSTNSRTSRASDTLHISKTGFRDTSIALSSLNQNLGTITLNKDIVEDRPIIMGYLETMRSGDSWKKLDFTSVDYVIHAFITANGITGDIEFIGASSFEKIKNEGIADSVHSAGSKIVFSLGGAAHSYPLKQVSKSASLITKFADNIVEKLNEWNYDGVDIDLEFPWGGNEPQEHLDLMKGVYEAVKANNPNHIVMFGVSPGYLIDQYKWSQLSAYSDYAFYFGYDWNNPACGPMKNPGVTQNALGGASFEASVRGAVDYIIGTGYPESKIVVGLPFYTNGGTSYFSASESIKSATPDPNYMEVSSAGYWPNAAGITMKTEAVTKASESVLIGGAVVAGVGFWEWGHEDPDSPDLSKAIKQAVGKN